MKLSVIIVHWNTPDLLVQCLESLAGENQPDPRCEVLVVDNASTDPAVAAVWPRFPWVRQIHNRENVGFARANNQAIRASRGEYVVLLNPDTVVQGDALSRLLDFMETHPDVGVAGPRLLNGDGTLQTSCYPMPTLGRELWRLFHLDHLHTYGTYDIASWSLEQPRPVDVVQGACMVLRRAVLDEVGLLDEDYFMYTEEVDWCYRIRRAGWPIYWVPRATVVHFGGQSTQQVAMEMFLRLYESKLFFFRKHHGVAAAQLYKLILGFAALIRLMAAPLTLLESPRRRRQHLSLARNYNRLLRALPSL